MARASSPCVRSTDSRVRALGLGHDCPSHGCLDETPKPHHRRDADAMLGACVASASR
ncbi:MAG: hypothetical protein NZ874_00335 [Fimbriimonadales bacterium]|nr:hypothetical protein [Fimbriimonadales bacterium]